MWLLRRLSCLAVAGLLAACAPLTSWDVPAGPDIARLETIRLLPVVFATSQVFTNQQARIDAILRQDLSAALERRGYQVAADAQGAASAGNLQVTITWVEDGRLYFDDEGFIQAVYPEVRLYAAIRLTRSSDGAVLLAGKTLGAGYAAYSTLETNTPYTEPQRDLARRISELFPTRT
jgi:hypothetical protein